MGESTLAVIRAPYAVLRRMVALAGLQPSPGREPYYDEMLVRLTKDCIDTPAGSTASSLATYCTVELDVLSEYDHRHDDAVVAVFPIQEVLDWLAWVSTDAALDTGDNIAVSFVGDEETGNVSEMRIEGGESTVTVDCHLDPVLLEQITLELPDRFDADDRFALEDGSLAPTVVETTVDELRRLTRAVDIDSGRSSYPFVVRDGTLSLTLSVGCETRAETTLSASVDGPDVHNEYGPELASLLEVVSGDVTLQTGPDEPLVLVRESPLFTLRYVLIPVGW
ncbi:hypothetical protein [Haloarchaeobius sp. TZWWS8]|uniref:hypothetical protein n=1 Tax=Haloarchaeobius sp. TZWWS8 TaxID=3446121 RepID=UPI003EBE5135